MIKSPIFTPAIPQAKIMPGTKGLETLIRAFYLDYFPNVEWLQVLAKTNADRAPIR